MSGAKEEIDCADRRDSKVAEIDWRGSARKPPAFAVCAVATGQGAAAAAQFNLPSKCCVAVRERHFYESE